MPPNKAHEVERYRIYVSSYPFLCVAAFSQTLTSAEAAEKIRQATPAALPQTPVVKKAKSDATDEGLKGRVKSVSVSVEETGKSRIRTEQYYDNVGNLTKRIYYDYQGNPSDVTVYGFLDGKRVFETVSIRYDYDPPPPKSPPGSRSEPIPPADERYDYSSEYKYDDSGKLIEQITYSNTGKVLSRVVYTHEGNKRERTTLDSKGQISSVTKEIADSKDNLVEVIYPARGSYGESIYSYKHEKFDSHGNWTRRTVTGKAGRYDGGQTDFQRAEIRVITYH